MKQLGYLRTLLGFAFRENPLLYLTVVISLLSVASEIAAMAGLLPLLSIAAGQATPQDALIVHAARRAGIEPTAHALILIFVGLFMLRVLTQFASQGLTSWLSKRLHAQLGSRAFAMLVRRVPMRQVEQKSIGSFITLAGDEAFRASTVITSLNQVLTQGCWRPFTSSPSGITRRRSGSRCWHSVRGLFSAAGILPRVEPARRTADRAVKCRRFAVRRRAERLRSVRAFSAESYVAEAYRKQLWEYVRTLTKVDLVSMLSRLGPALLLLSAVGAVALWPGGASLSPDLPFAITIVIFLMRFFPVVGQLLQIGLRVVSDARAGRDVTHLVDFEAPRSAQRSARADLGPIDHIEFRRLSFSHLPDRPVLRNVSFRLDRGKSYALVGVSGSGKSTILDLVLDFYPVDTGQTPHQRQTDR
jgi:ABC-type multidrug transport system fused ATPase/permease subunit